MVLMYYSFYSPILRNRDALAHFKRAHGNEKAGLRKRLREALTTIWSFKISDGRHGGGATAFDGSDSYETRAISRG